MELFFDVETTGLPSRGASYRNLSAYEGCRIVSIAWILRTSEKIFSQRYCIINQSPEIPDSVPLGASFIHGISRKMTNDFGKDLKSVLEDFLIDVSRSKTIVCHNAQFDKGVVASEMFRLGWDSGMIEMFLNDDTHCTMLSNVDLVNAKFLNSNRKKWPKLEELHRYCFHKDFESAHNSLMDTEATARCYYFVKNNVIDLTD